MDLSNPIRSAIPSLHGDVLSVLARTDSPLTGRGIAALISDASPSGVNLALRSLIESGLVSVKRHPPANLYVLNRQHLAAPAIIELAALRPRLIDAMRQDIDGWPIAPWGVWLFGSAARGDGDTDSDIDVLVVRPDTVEVDLPRWIAQLGWFASAVTDWTGNECSIVEYGQHEFADFMNSDERLVGELRRDAIALSGQPLPIATTAGAQK